LKYLSRSVVSILLLASLTACVTDSTVSATTDEQVVEEMPMTAEELAARETDSDASLWGEEDYETIAAKGCLKYKAAMDFSLGDGFYDWDAQSLEWTTVNLTTGALEGHPKWGPIHETVFALWTNSISRSVGQDGYEVPSQASLDSFQLCSEVGVNLSE
jgi:hypothetical protein